MTESNPSGPTPPIPSNDAATTAAETFPHYVPSEPQPRSVSFYVAIFLALLLVISGGLNLVLLVLSAFGSASGLTGGSGVASSPDGDNYQLVRVAGARSADHSFLRVRIDGAIAEASAPMIGAVGGTVSVVRRALRAAAAEDSVRAILLEINSPGGGVTDSDEIHRLLTDYKDEHPKIKILALFGDMAASGGYYIAMAADHVIARPTTITGSIGVIISSYNVAKALDKVGIESVTIVSPDTPFKDMLSPTKPIDPVAQQKVQTIVQEMYERFVTIVDDGRPDLDRAAVRSAANGQIYSAKQALDLGLIDAIGDLDDAIETLATMVDVPRDEVRLIEQRRVPTLFDNLFAARQPQGLTADGALSALLRSTGPKLLYFWPGGR